MSEGLLRRSSSGSLCVNSCVAARRNSHSCEQAASLLIFARLRVLERRNAAPCHFADTLISFLFFGPITILVSQQMCQNRREADYTSKCNPWPFSLAIHSVCCCYLCRNENLRSDPKRGQQICYDRMLDMAVFWD